jgi:copper chaperone CopZ
VNDVRFVVEEAGCESCAARVRTALAPVATVEAVDVDAAADEAVVRLRSATGLSQEAVTSALAKASEGAGHAYRVKPGSWRSTAERSGG